MMNYQVIPLYIPNKKGLKLDTEIYRPEARGQLPVVILFHGFTGYKEDPALVDIAKRLAQSGIVTVRFTSSGFGGSEGILEKDYRFSNYCMDADVVYEYVSTLPYINNTRIGIYGHSIGGRLAVLFTHRHKDVKALCVASASMSFEGTMYDEVKEDWKSRGFIEKVSGRDGTTVRVPYAYFVDAEAIIGDVQAAASTLKTPYAFVFAGTRDTEVPWQQTKKLFDLLHCPKEWKLFNNLGHKYRAYPDIMPAVNAAVVDFFRRTV